MNLLHSSLNTTTEISVDPFVDRTAPRPVIMVSKDTEALDNPNELTRSPPDGIIRTWDHDREDALSKYSPSRILQPESAVEALIGRLHSLSHIRRSEQALIDRRIASGLQLGFHSRPTTGESLTNRAIRPATKMSVNGNLIEGLFFRPPVTPSRAQ